MVGQRDSRARESRNREGRDRYSGDGSDFVERLVHVNRVAKVVKGGKRMAFAALVVVGDRSGRVGFGHGRAREVPDAVLKASERAKRSLIRVPLREGRTLHHRYEGRHGSGVVILRPAAPGTGVIAGGPVRSVFEVLGVQDVVAKIVGSSNPYNAVRAAFDALRCQQSPRMVAQRRGKGVRDVLRHRLLGGDDGRSSPVGSEGPSGSVAEG